MKKGIIYQYQLNKQTIQYIGIGNDGSQVKSDFFDQCGMNLYIKQMIKKGVTKKDANMLYWKHIAKIAGVSKNKIDLLNIDAEKLENIKYNWSASMYDFEVVNSRERIERSKI